MLSEVVLVATALGPSKAGLEDSLPVAVLLGEPDPCLGKGSCTAKGQPGLLRLFD